MAIQCVYSHKASMMRRHLTNELAISLIQERLYPEDPPVPNQSGCDRAGVRTC